jgi:radical SAM protein with 4Fe4S-binding SPASM domain
LTKKYGKIHIEISNVCNLQCSFCPEVVRTKKLMSPKMFAQIIQQVAPIAEQICLHLMGEPLLHPQLSEIVEICHSFSLPIFLVTNGVLLKEKNEELLLHPAFCQVNFSLHSFNDNFPDRDPTQYLERIFRYSERALVERPDLYINYRLWNLLGPRGADDRNRNLLRLINHRFNSEVNLTVDVRQRKGLRLKQRLYMHFDTEFTWPSMDLPPLGTTGFCYGLSSHFGILADGTVVPCCLDKEAAIPLGNVQNRSIKEILESPRSLAIADGFRRGHLIEDLCKRCQYIDRFKGKPRAQTHRQSRLLKN